MSPEPRHPEDFLPLVERGHGLLSDLARDSVRAGRSLCDLVFLIHEAGPTAPAFRPETMRGAPGVIVARGTRADMARALGLGVEVAPADLRTLLDDHARLSSLAARSADAAVDSARELGTTLAGAVAERDALAALAFDVSALATGETDLCAVDPLAALGKALEAIAALHKRVDDLREELSNMAERTDGLAAIGEALGCPGATATECVAAARELVEAWQIERANAATAMAADDVARTVCGEENARLRAIVAGRDVPPTDAEIAAHHAAGGRWLVSHDHDGRRLTYTLDATPDDARAEARYAGPHPRRWWALDATGRPCPWPTTEGGR